MTPPRAPIPPFSIPWLPAGILLPTLLLASACAWSAGGAAGCRPVSRAVALPPGLEESSGVAPGREADVVWTHNDSGGEAVLWAVSLDGALRGRLHLAGAASVDWEAAAAGPCVDGRCLYVADTGDNREVRKRVSLYRVALPAARSDTVDAIHLPIELPDGPRDIEALLALPDESLLLVTKGRNHPVTVYRYPPPQRPGTPVTLERVQELTDRPLLPAAWITGGGADAAGRLAVVRSYEELVFYRIRDGRLERLEGADVRLGSLREPQGEAVAFLPDGRLVLTTEAGAAGMLGGQGGLRLLRCPGLPGG